MKIIKKDKILMLTFTFFGFLTSASLAYSEESIKPNVILITIDALRPDHLGCYGYVRDTTPNIDKICRDGTKFTQCIVPSPWTMPSLVSLLTSTYPWEHKIQSWDSKLDSRLPNVFKIF